MRGRRNRLLILSWVGMLLLGWAGVFIVSSFADWRFATPEGTLDTYIDALRKGDLSTASECFAPPATDFYLPGPIAVTSYHVRRRIIYGPAEVKDWNSKGIKPPAREGDIELQVRRIINGKPQMFSYNLRQVASGWKIYSHAAWGVD